MPREMRDMECDVAFKLDRRSATVTQGRRNVGRWSASLVAHTALLLASVGGAGLFATPLWLVTAAACFAFASVQIGFLAHDFEHGQVAVPRALRDVVGLVVWNGLLGVSLAWWRDKHRRHHEHTHVDGHDPDLYGLFAYDASRARLLHGSRRWFIACQAWLFWPLAACARLYYQSLSLLAAARLPVARRVPELAALVVHHAMFASLAWATLGGRAPAFFAVAQALSGLYMALVFSTNHLGMPLAQEKRAGRAWQIAHTRNISAGRLGTYLLGGLNLQIEHHLYPTLDRCALQAIQPRVQQQCAAAGIFYCQTGLLPALLEVQRSLSRVALAARTC